MNQTIPCTYFTLTLSALFGVLLSIHPALAQNNACYLTFGCQSNPVSSQDYTNPYAQFLFDAFNEGYSNPYSSQDYGNPYSSHDYGNPYSSQDYGNPYSSRDYGNPYSSQDYGNPYSSRDYGNPYSSQDYGNPYSSHDYGNPYSSQDYGNPYSSRDYGNPYSSQDYTNYSSPQHWKHLFQDLENRRKCQPFISALDAALYDVKKTGEAVDYYEGAIWANAAGGNGVWDFSERKAAAGVQLREELAEESELLEYYSGRAHEAFESLRANRCLASFYNTEYSDN